MAFPKSRRGLAKDKLNTYAIVRFRTIDLKSHPIAKDKLKTSCISVKQIIDNDDDEANPPPPFHDEKEEEEEKEEDNQGADEEKMTIRENNNDDDDDDEEELMRVFTWRVDGHEYKRPMKKILVCSSSQQSRLVVITVDVFNLSIVKKKLTKFRLG